MFSYVYTSRLCFSRELLYQIKYSSIVYGYLHYNLDLKEAINSNLQDYTKIVAMVTILNKFYLHYLRLSCSVLENP